MARHGDIGPFLAVVFKKVIKSLSNRDLIRLDEKTMKVVLLAYQSLSEAELGFGYSDLVLLPNRIRPMAQAAFLLELKYLRAGASEPAVLEKLDEADTQLRRYLADPKLVALSGAKPWRTLSVAFVGTEACWYRALDGEAKNAGA